MLSETFQKFFDSEKSSGILLIVCTAISLIVANSAYGPGYSQLWQTVLWGMSLEHWVNDGLMAIFFLLIGLELERELYVGELSNFRHALLPIFAALGGIVVPAALHYLFNSGLPSQRGMGIPMATDIAFALGVLALLADRIPTALKVFVVAFAVIDDLGAILVIAIFYTKQVSFGYLLAALAVWGLLLAGNRWLRLRTLLPYVAGGAVLWIFLYKSGVHATIAGILLAFAIPFSGQNDRPSPSHRLENFLHRPVAFFILPVFALANTAVPITGNWLEGLLSANSLGIIAGLVVGKPFGVLLFCGIAVAFGICGVPEGVSWRHLAGAGILGGIGFTMSIFITNLAFPGDQNLLNGAKIAILFASFISGCTGFLWLRVFGSLRDSA